MATVKHLSVIWFYSMFLNIYSNKCLYKNKITELKIQKSKYFRCEAFVLLLFCSIYLSTCSHPTHRRNMKHKDENVWSKIKTRYLDENVSTWILKQGRWEGEFFLNFLPGCSSAGTFGPSPITEQQRVFWNFIDFNFFAKWEIFSIVKALSVWQ